MPLVEGVMLRNTADGRRAAILINWAFHIEEPVTVTLRGAGAVGDVKSLALDAVFPAKTEEGLVRVTLPRLDQGDILLLK